GENQCAGIRSSVPGETAVVENHRKPPGNGLPRGSYAFLPLNESENGIFGSLPCVGGNGGVRSHSAVSPQALEVCGAGLPGTAARCGSRGFLLEYWVSPYSVRGRDVSRGTAPVRRPLGRTPFDRSGVPQVTGKELSPSAHQKSEVRNVLRALVADGWTLRGEGHWGRLHCPCGCS